jgi:hypothetical protein
MDLLTSSTMKLFMPVLGPQIPDNPFDRTNSILGLTVQRTIRRACQEKFTLTQLPSSGLSRPQSSLESFSGQQIDEH